MPEWPEWWSWEIELSTHLLKRMVDRRFTESDLRAMLADASGFRPAYDLNRWLVETSWSKRAWRVIVEPIDSEKVLLVITAYPID
jgi:hypothetical protein